MRRWSSSRWVLTVYYALVLVAAVLAAARLVDSLEMPGLGALELVLPGLPWSLALGVEPMSRFGWSGMIAIVFGGLLLNWLLLHGLAAWFERHWWRRRTGTNRPGHG